MENREKIIQAALALLREKDERAEEITVREICTRAGVGLGLINYYFTSKDRLIEICIERIVNGIVENFRNIVKKTNSLSPNEKLKFLGEMTLTFLFDHAAVSKISILTDMKFPQSRRQYPTHLSSLSAPRCRLPSRPGRKRIAAKNFLPDCKHAKRFFTERRHFSNDGRQFERPAREEKISRANAVGNPRNRRRQMKIAVINGTEKRGVTFRLKELFLTPFRANSEITEFYLPKDCPAFCTGCTMCISSDEHMCKDEIFLAPIRKALDEADLIVFTSPPTSFTQREA